MSRPPLGESRTERFQMAITANEIEAIDEWRFANCIGTRSEAVRRLVKVGVSASPDVLEALHEARTQVAELQSRLGIVDPGTGTLSIIDRAIAKATGDRS